ncbi:MAG TPA: NAD(P)H-hydrate dehydratase [Candidatus Aminicenantes bacterium]|mgnify:CR=1 FL=1|nr:NAD(P)H-hydrate dehydratase [Candidatus Aminicenantes bacterium]
MKILTSRQMREMDRRTIEETGIPGCVLMENAGVQVVRQLLRRFPNLGGEEVVIVCGKGNNGGDGLVVARHLANLGANPLILLLSEKAGLKGDAALNLRIAGNMGIPVIEADSPEAWKRQGPKLKKASIIVDAVFGTGLVRAAAGLYARAIEDMNKSRAYKIAVDLPSGLSSDSAEIIGPCVKADLTVALAAPKVAHVFPPAEDCVGELVVAPIGIPSALFTDPGLKLEMAEENGVAPYFRKRRKDTHKGTFGHLLVISGSLGKTGAAALAAKAALKMGAGLVTVATPQSCLSLVARSAAELMTEPLPETSEKTISAEALPRALELLKGKDGVLLGPGLSTHPSTAEFVVSLLPRIGVPAVIDADGLNNIAADRGILKSLKAPAVLTPHPGEFGRLLRASSQEVLARKLELGPAFAREYGVCLVLKGYRTLTCSPEGRVFVNPTGNPGMATGGSGDVLSGMIASIIMREKDVPGAAAAAVYVHGLSGDLGAGDLGERSLTAGDIIRYLPRALKSMETE